MRLAATALAAGFLPLAATGFILEERANDLNLNASTIAKIPTCLLQCASAVLPKFNCKPGDSCYCNVAGPLKDALAACTTTTCTSVEEQLVGLRLQAELCKFPTHHNAPRTELVAYILFGIASVFLAARILSRWPRLEGAGYGWDDWIILIAYPVALGMTVTAHYAVVYGSGRDMYYLSSDELIHFFLWVYVGEPLYIVGTGMTQLSLIFLYLRVWPVHSVSENSKFRMACKLVAWTLGANMTTFTIIAMFGCRRVQAGWNVLKTGPGAVCVDRTAAGYALGAITIALHITVLLLPVRRLAALKIPLGEKIGVLATFLLGFVVTICSIVRMFYIYKTATVVNVTYNFSFVGLWSLIEVYCTIICCCIPATAGLFRKILSRGCFAGLWTRSFSSMARSRNLHTPLDRETDAMYRNCIASPTYEMDARYVEPKVLAYNSGHSVTTASELSDRTEQPATMKDHTAFNFDFSPEANEEYQAAGTRDTAFWHKKTHSSPASSPDLPAKVVVDTTSKELSSPEATSPVPEFWFYSGEDDPAGTTTKPTRPTPARFSYLDEKSQHQESRG